MSRLFISLVLIFFSYNSLAQIIAPDPDQKLTNKNCIECHEQTDKQLISDWRSSQHASSKPVTNCINCHGDSHKQMASYARRDNSCVNCHNKNNPATHSYQSSKHGVLMQIEKNTYDWNKKLQQANYRAPGCGYCHMHQGNHQLTRSINMMTVCQDCHAPRYLSRLNTNGVEMYKIALMKLQEAEALIKKEAADLSIKEHEKITIHLEKMKKHLKNVKLGIGHQSPDYQWWHGQPALDGDLLRMKGIIGEVKRQKNIDKIAAPATQPPISK